VIPRIIHQIWKNEAIPVQCSDYVKTLKKLHPDWRYMLWTDKKADWFMKRYFSEYYDLYSNYKYNILRADLLRYCVVQKFGGVYVDLDFEFFKPLDSILENKNLYFFNEPDTPARNKFNTNLICNFLFGATRNNSVFLNLIKTIKNNIFAKIENTDLSKLDKNFFVLYTTGPIVLTKVINTYTKKDVNLFIGNASLVEGHANSLGKHWYTGMWLNHEY